MKTHEAFANSAISLTSRAKTLVLLALALFTAAVLCAPGIAPSVHAAEGDIGAASMGGTTTYYKTYKELREFLAKQKGNQVTVYVLEDWDARGNKDAAKPDECLVIPSGSNVTLYLNGHRIDRGLTGGSGDQSKDNGEVIRVETGATLNIRSEEHTSELQSRI